MFLEKIVGDFGDKKRWREYKARLKALPDPYRHAGAALERYLLNLGPTDDADSMLSMVEDLVDLLEGTAAAGTPIRDVVGDDPAEFAETFMQNYGGGSWIRRERSRLSDAVARAEQEERP